MNPTEPSTPPSDSPAAEPPAPMSLMARLLNVVAVPGEVFEQVRNAPRSIANWLVPALTFGVAGTAVVLVMLSNPAFTQKMWEQQTKGIEKQVSEGKLTRQQGNERIDMIQKYGPVFAKVGGAAVSFTVGFCAVFSWAFFFWLISRGVLGT